MSDRYALLQTDVVDSTQLAERLGDVAISALWEAHDRVARDLLREWRGREIDKSDGFLLLFATASDAVGFAVVYHRALSKLNVLLKARAGLHVGPVTLRENSGADVALGAKPLEVEGIAKPTVARVMSLAAGGQTLLTAEAKLALGSTPLRVQGHGHWRMKGLEEPLELFEVGDDNAPFVPPSNSSKVYRVVRRNDLWLPVQEVRHSLPAERNAFIGRNAPLQELTRRFAAGARLVSVLGIGGTGKSRLAQRFGWTWLGDYAGGVWFCDLSQARTVDGIAYAVAQGLHVPLVRGDPMAQLGSAIEGRGPCLVILDNFEQVSRYAEQTLGQWLDRAGEAHFIVTTREVLGIPGEEALALAQMSVEEGATLFLKRAAATRRDFQPTSEDQQAIEPLVKLLDGLPLAIELAAARVRVMAPRMLLQRMSDRFKLLASTGGRRDRQATLRATLDWSWDLLSTVEKMALARLSVFEVGFTLAAAEAVLDIDDVEGAPWPIDTVQSLVEKSLVRQVNDHRFDLLGSVQEYAAEHLRTAQRFPGSGPAALAAAYERHWRYFAGLDERSVVADQCIETDNVVAACRRAIAHGDSPSAIATLVNAWAALRLCGPFRHGVELAASMRAMPRLTAAQTAMLEWVAGDAAYVSGNASEAHACLERGLLLADVQCEAKLRCTLGESLTTEGRIDEARSNLTRSLELARESNDQPSQCRAMNVLGALSHGLGRLDEARSWFEMALDVARELHDLRWEGGLLGNLAALHYEQGRLADARAEYQQALALAQQAGDRRWEGNTRCNLGLLLHEEGKSADARVQFESALKMAREMGHALLKRTVLCNLGLVDESQGHPENARSNYERAIAVARELGDRRSEGQFLNYLGMLHARLGQFADARQQFDCAEALLTEVADDSSLALLLCSRAEAHCLEGDQDSARAPFMRASALAAKTAAGPASELVRRVARLRETLKY